MQFPSSPALIIGLILSWVLDILTWAIIVNAVMSWLFAFNVINYRNPFVRGVQRVLDAIVGPILWPFRKVIPPLGGMDITPIIALLLIQLIQSKVLPLLVAFLYQYTG